MNTEARSVLDQPTALRLLLVNRSMLLSYINSITGDPTLTEDVFQEVSLVVMEKYPAVTSLDGFRPWARTIARFQSLKAVNRRQSTPLILKGDLIDQLDKAWEEHDHDNPRAASIFALQHCLDKLTPKAKELVQMRYHQDLTGQIIAEHLQKPLNTVYVALSRIHRSLGDCIRNKLTREKVEHVG